MNKNIEKLNEPVAFVCTIIIYYFYIQMIKELLKSLFKAQKDNRFLVPHFNTAWLGLLIIVPMIAVGIYGYQNIDHPRNVMNMGIIITGFILVGCYDYLACLKKNNKQNKNKRKVKNLSKTNTVTSKTNTDTSSTFKPIPVPEYKKETLIPTPLNS
jgi:UDP-N-acetylmuramyl pentapeptide phosphotransferase/UDP-N-acetylglucosamine-1-phosphate transferase